jgi:hypothetical protein
MTDTVNVVDGQHTSRSPFEGHMGTWNQSCNSRVEVLQTLAARHRWK